MKANLQRSLCSCLVLGLALWVGQAEALERGSMYAGEGRYIAVTGETRRILPDDRSLQEVLYRANAGTTASLTYGSLFFVLLLLFSAGVVVGYVLSLNRRLHHSEQRYRVAYDSAPVAFVLADLDCRVTAWNRCAEQMFGWRKEEALGRSFMELIVPEDARDHVAGVIDRLRAGETDLPSVNWNVAKDGTRLLCQWNNALLRDHAGRPREMIAVALDLTDRQRTEDTLRTLTTAIESAADAVMITDREGVIEYVNPAFTAMTGYSAQEAIGRRSSLVKSDQQDKAFYEQLWHTIHSGRAWQGELINRRKDGSLYSEAMTIAPVPGRDGSAGHFVAIKRDVSHRKALEDRLARLAHYDELTGLPNRSLFFDRLGQAMAEANRDHSAFALLFLDLDGFKAINDRHGHHVGDALLKDVAARLRDRVRASDTVARMGGDEFTVILRSVGSRREAETVAGKLLDALSEPFVIHGHPCQLGASIGIAIFPDDASGAEPLLKLADDAMYEAKRGGGRRITTADSA